MATQQLHWRALLQVWFAVHVPVTMRAAATPRRSVVLLETPMLVVGGHLSAKQYCDEPLAGSMGVSQRGYFDSRQHCWRVISP